MCDPTVITVAAIGLTAAGTIQKAGAQRDAANASAANLEENARLADQSAADAILRGRFTEGRVRLQGEATANRQKVAIAGAGVDAQSGSALDVLSNTAGLSELDAQVVRSNAAREAWGYRTQGVQFRSRANMERQAGSNQALGTILGGIGGVARSAYTLSIDGGSGWGNGPGFEPTPMDGDWAGAYAGENY